MHRLKPRVGDHHEMVRVLAAMDEVEFRAVADEARGTSLIPLAELVIEGLAPDVDALAERIGEGNVVCNDIGRPCTTREVARRLRGDR